MVYQKCIGEDTMLLGKGSYRTYNREEIKERTDKYFTKTLNVVNMFGSKQVTYGVFLRTSHYRAAAA